MAYLVKETRVARGMTQEELSKKSGVSRQIISDLESGREVNTMVGTLKRLATALGCNVSDIFCDVSQNKI